MVAGGMESMSQVPHFVPTSRTDVKYGDAVLVDSIAHDDRESLASRVDENTNGLVRQHFPMSTTSRSARPNAKYRVVARRPNIPQPALPSQSGGRAASNIGSAFWSNFVATDRTPAYEIQPPRFRCSHTSELNGAELFG